MEAIFKRFVCLTIHLCLFGIFEIRLVNGDAMPYLTKEEYQSYSRFLEKEISKTYASDGDDNAEIVVQSVAGGMTFYKASSAPDKTVFFSSGTKNSGKNVVVLMRGEDYINPMNKHRFVVLRKRGSGSEYNVHLGTIWNDIEMGLNVVWENVVVGFMPQVRPLLPYFRLPYLFEDVDSYNLRPICAWFGFALACVSDQIINGKGNPDAPATSDSKPGGIPGSPKSFGGGAPISNKSPVGPGASKSGPNGITGSNKPVSDGKQGSNKAGSDGMQGSNKPGSGITPKPFKPEAGGSQDSKKSDTFGNQSGTKPSDTAGAKGPVKGESSESYVTHKGKQGFLVHQQKGR